MAKDRTRRRTAALALAALTAGCTSLSVLPTSPTAGSFRAEARAVRFLGMRIPRSSRDAAIEMASDRGLPNTRLDSAESYPALFFPFSWLNSILGFEGTIVKGRYGNPP